MDSIAKKILQLDELRISGADLGVIHAHEKKLEDEFYLEFNNCINKNEYEKALGTVFWSMLLEHRQEEYNNKIEKALFVLKRMAITPDGIDTIKTIKSEPRFKEIKQRVCERWHEIQNTADVEEFDKLDREKDLLNKNFDRLERLLENGALMRVDANKYNLAKIRLIREREACTKYIEIISELEGVAKDTDRENRDKIINEKIKNIEMVAIALSSNDSNEEYAKQIRRFVEDTRKSIRESDSAVDLQRIINEKWARLDAIDSEISELMLGDNDPNEVLRNACEKVSYFADEYFIGHIQTRFAGWFREKGMNQYRRITLRLKPDKQSEYLRATSDIISSHGNCLPTVIKDGLGKFIEKKMSEIRPSPPQPVEPSSSMHVTAKKGTGGIIRNFFNNLFRR